MKKSQEKIISAISAQRALNEVETMKLRYALELIRNEGIKTILLLVFFCLAGRIEAFLLCMAVACTVRVFAGGMHMKTNIGCFIMSFALLYAEIMLLPRLVLPAAAYNGLLVISIAVICLLSPIASFKRPFQGEKRYRTCKRNAILFSLLWGVLLLFGISDPYLKSCGVWAFALQAMQMIMTGLFRYIKKKKEEPNKC